MSVDWQRIGRDQPYWGVLSTDRFRSERLSEDAKAEFFKTGEDHLRHVLCVIRRVRPSFQPKRTLDFGCGVGRVTIPIARMCKEVVGVDVSDSMLEEARRNAMLAKVAIELRKDISGTFDFIHSHIVFQHIRRDVGMALVRDIVKRLNPGGAAMLNFPYWREASAFRKMAHFLRSYVPPVHNVGNVLQGKPWGSPLMMMNVYNVSSLLREFRMAGVSSTLMEYRDTGGFRHGLFYLFKD
jgi:2-polyprenyl-3-methyl-5-hydroxy-6-metoxy-1,4-benzoquinol methylase